MHLSRHYADGRSCYAWATRVGRDAFFVQFVAEAGGGRGDDVAVLPDDRFGQDVAVELGEGLDALLDEEVGRAHVDVDRRGGGERAAPHMRGDVLN